MLNLREIIASKNPALAEFLPELILSQFENIIHLKEINEILSRFGQHSAAIFMERMLDYLGVDLRIHGEDELPALERPVLISNHPLGGLDGIVLLSLLSRHFGEVRLMVNEFLMKIPQLNKLFVPVNKLGTNRQHWQQYRDLFSGEAAILHFPAGLCSRRKGGRLSDLPWNGSYVRLCRDSGRPIVPCFFAGENSSSFYALANLRRWLRIGFNIEMFLLPREMFRQRGQRQEVWIGKAIQPSQLLGRDSRSLNTSIRHQVYALPKEKTREQARKQPRKQLPSREGRLSEGEGGP